jgi:hypothetical protein
MGVVTPSSILPLGKGEEAFLMNYSTMSTCKGEIAD